MGAAGQHTLWSVVDMSGKQADELNNIHGMLHGGVIATIFDGMCGILLEISGVPGVTANLSINYKKAVPLLKSAQAKRPRDSVQRYLDQVVKLASLAKR